jgi:hypothetical protein
MKYFHKLLLAVASASFFAAAALAQTSGTLTNHAFAIGKGAGVTGYTSLLCASAQVAVGQSAADPICQSLSADATMDATGAVTLANSTTTRSHLGLAIGTNVEAWDADLDCVAAISTTGLVKRTGAGTCSAGAVALSDLATGSQDTIIGYWSSTSATAVAINNCTGALTYSTATHTFGCNASAGTGTVTSISAGTGISVSPSPITSTGTITNTGVVTVKKQVFTSSGTYTPSTGMVFAVIECVGGGGGGAGGPLTATGIGSGGGGGSGGYSRTLATAATVGASKAVTIGTAGTGGATGTTNGGAGGSSSVGTICIANGGGGGVQNGAGIGGSGGAGATAGTGDIALSGNGGLSGNGTSLANITGIAGQGASGHFGGGPPGVVATATTINGTSAAANSGAGGNGGLSANTSSGATGGNGGSGLVLITEYNSQ